MAHSRTPALDIHGRWPTWHAKGSESAHRAIPTLIVLANHNFKGYYETVPVHVPNIKHRASQRAPLGNKNRICNPLLPITPPIGLNSLSCYHNVRSSGVLEGHGHFTPVVSAYELILVLHVCARGPLFKILYGTFQRSWIWDRKLPSRVSIDRLWTRTGHALATKVYSC